MDHRKFRQSLDSLGWTQAELARRIHVHVNTISRWLSPGGHVPGPAIAYIELALEISAMANKLTQPRRA